MKQPLIPFFWGMRIEATPESARTVIRPVVAAIAAAAQIPNADANEVAVLP